MKLVYQIKASALQYTLLVSIVIAVLIGSFLTLSHVRSLFKIQSNQLLDVINASNQGVEYGLKNDTVIIDSTLVPFKNTTATVSRSAWGGFTLLKSTAISKSNSFRKVCLTGFYKDKNRDAVYLTELRQPLVLVGNSKIQGTSYLGKSGIKAGVINRNSFLGNQLTNGVVRVSAGVLPKLDQQWKDDINRLVDFIPTNEVIITPMIKHRNSFKNETKVLYNLNRITVSDEYIGNLIIKSETEIVVESYAKLKDVFLIAPKIRIKEGFKGSVHVLAEETILVEENVGLFYPSSLVVFHKEKEASFTNESSISISIGKSSTLNGTLMYLSEKKEIKEHEVSVSISDTSIINGQIYVEGNTELFGTVNGSVYTERFIVDLFGSRYVNYLFGGKILNSQLHEVFCGLPLKNENKGVAKWLY